MAKIVKARHLQALKPLHPLKAESEQVKELLLILPAL